MPSAQKGSVATSLGINLITSPCNRGDKPSVLETSVVVARVKPVVPDFTPLEKDLTPHLEAKSPERVSTAPGVNAPPSSFTQHSGVPEGTTGHQVPAQQHTVPPDSVRPLPKEADRTEALQNQVGWVSCAHMEETHHGPTTRQRGTPYQEMILGRSPKQQDACKLAFQPEYRQHGREGPRILGIRKYY